jgi:MFS family permease
MKEKMKRNIYVDYIFRFISSFSITAAIWVLYLTYKGLPLWQIGILEGVFHITGFLSEVPSGAIADLIGRKKVIICSRLCTVISCTIMLFAVNIWQFALGFIFCAWGYNLLSGSEEALIYDSFLYLDKEKEYYKVNSHLGVIIEIAQGLAIFAGGLLAEISFTYCYLTAIVIAVISLIPCIMFQEAELNGSCKNQARISIKEHFKVSFQIMKENAEVTEILLFYSLVFTFYTSIYFYGQKYFLELGLNKVYISIIMLIVGIFSCLGAIMSEKVFHILKHKTKYIATFVIACSISGMWFRNLFLSVVCFIIIGFTNSLLYPLQSASLNKLIPSEQRATIISVSSMIFSMFMILLFPMIGFLADILLLHNIFLIVGVILNVVLSAIYIKAMKLRKFINEMNS